MTCSHCITEEPLRASEARLWERPVVRLTRARPYRCLRCGHRSWFFQDRASVPSSVKANRIPSWKDSLAKVRDRLEVPKLGAYLARMGTTDLYSRLPAVVRRYVFDVYHFRRG